MPTFDTKTQKPYILLLEEPEWKIKREHILARDSFKCRLCGKSETEAELHVHHKQYIMGLDPWEYNDDDLITLCADCHHIIHESTIIPTYVLTDGQLFSVDRTPCTRCGGTGYFPEYRHVENGVCFRCRGERYEESIHLVKQYEVSHNMRIEDLYLGYERLTDNRISTLLGEPLKIMYAYVDPAPSSARRKRVIIIVNTGLIIDRAYLDYRHYADKGEHLDVKSLLYRVGRYSDGTNFLIVTDKYHVLDKDALSYLLFRFKNITFNSQITSAHVVSELFEGDDTNYTIKTIIVNTESGDSVVFDADLPSDINNGTPLIVSSLRYKIEHFGSDDGNTFSKQVFVKGIPE